MKSSCVFCGGSRSKKYMMNGYNLMYCHKCKTLGVDNPPSDQEICEFYDGFNFQTSISNYKKINQPFMKKWMQGLVGYGDQYKMLDVGGGGGFFAKAFEEFGMGESTYIDLDKQACEFAKDDMKLDRVILDRVENLNDHVGQQKFDFIYCRHVVEHIKDPTDLIKACANLLTPGGVFLLQCPNGQSKEGVLFPDYWMKFLRMVKESNNWTWWKSWMFSFRPCYGWGIDPMRHLWAISGAGISSIFNEQDFSVKVSSASLADRIYSPYWAPKSTLEKLAATVSSKCCNRVYEGMHLNVEIRPKMSEPN